MPYYHIILYSHCYYSSYFITSTISCLKLKIYSLKSTWHDHLLSFTSAFLSVYIPYFVISNHSSCFFILFHHYSALSYVIFNPYFILIFVKYLLFRSPIFPADTQILPLYLFISICLHCNLMALLCLLPISFYLFSSALSLIIYLFFS